MSDKPTYLGLLNAIAVGEAHAHQYLSAWIATTTDPDVRAVLCTVAAREGEHGMAFAKRIDELGYAVRERDDGDAGRRMAIAASTELSDLEKLEKLGLHRLDTGAQPDVFDGMFTDHSIDVATGALLGRYIAEERDTARLLRGCYEHLCGARPDSSQPRVGDQLAVLERKVDALCRTVEELRQIVCAQSMPAPSS